MDTKNRDVIIDVRERDEFDAVHIDGSINLPLSMFSSMAQGIFSNIEENKKIVFMCRSGKRAENAKQQALMQNLLGAKEHEVYPGGILAWQSAGHEVVMIRSNYIPILRQVQLIAGAMIFVSVILSLFTTPYLSLVGAFAGAGLMFAGATGKCAMADLLNKMPWNKSNLCGQCAVQKVCMGKPHTENCPNS